MKGVILNIVEEVVIDSLGAQAWENLLDEVGSDGVFTSLGTYDDRVLVRIVAAAAAGLSTTPADVLRLVGRQGYAKLAGRYPQISGRYQRSADLMADLDRVIHPQVLALTPGAAPPRFEAERDGPRLLLRYSSQRGLCHLAEGLAAGAAAAFGEPATVTQPRCVHQGDDGCVIVVDYTAGPDGGHDG